MTVLIIDADTGIRESTASYLVDKNYRVVMAAGGQEGIDCFHSSCPDLILLAIDLPNDDSFQTLQSLQYLAPEQPLILLAPVEQTQELIRCMRLGVSEYLLKPIPDPEMLHLSISNSLKRANLVAQNNSYRKKLELINRELEERVEIFRHDQQAGRHVQMSVLPRTPEVICDFEFSHCIIPSLYLSGDSVDYKPLNKNKVVFYIADVSGHGSSSAFVTVLLRFRLEQVRREFIRNRFAGKYSPADVLELLNKDLLDANLDKHITLFMGILDENKRTLTYSVAGHYPLPVLYSGKVAQFIKVDEPSFPLGLTGEAEYYEQTMDLDDQFNMTLFSDGVLECLAMKNIEDKEGYLLNLITESAGDYARIKILLNLDNLTNVPDDIAMMSVKSL
ncbi:MAG: SpoIIE family protein phosphatase [Pseudohongiellaceae bacterium]